MSMNEGEEPPLGSTNASKRVKITDENVDANSTSQDTSGASPTEQKSTSLPNRVDDTIIFHLQQCIICHEGDRADVPMLEEHGCPQCKKDAWKICEECEDTLLGRSCPVCRGDYSPLVLYEFPNMNPPASLANEPDEMKAMFLQAFRVKISLMAKLVMGSNVAVKMSNQNILKFSLPKAVMSSDRNTEIAPEELRFLNVSIPVTEERLEGGMFKFGNDVWTELGNIIPIFNFHSRMVV